MKRILMMVVAITFLSCSKDENTVNLSINQEKVSLKKDESFRYEVKLGSSTVNMSEVVTESSNPAVGELTKSGEFLAQKVGTTNIVFKHNNQSVSSEVTVIPTYNLFAEPINKFGASMSAIKSDEKRVFNTSTDKALFYNGENSNLKNVMYLFENNKMSSSVMLFPSDKDLVAKVSGFYNERYKYEGLNEGVLFFTGKDIVIGLGVNSSLGFNAIYMPNTSAKAKASLAKAQSNGLSNDLKAIAIR